MTGLSRRMKRPRPCRALIIVMALLPITAWPSPPPADGQLLPISATYGARMEKGLALEGVATRTLNEQEDGSWLYRFDVDSFIADIDESLTFRWQDGRVVPLEYRYSLRGLMVRDRRRSMSFDWQADRVSGSYDGETFAMDATPGALDPLGFQLQLRQDLKAGKRDMSYAVADDGDFDDDRFAVIGSETQSTRFGELQTVKVEKVRDQDSKRSTLMWFAPELDFLLVKLVQVEPDGSRYEVTLDDATLPGQPQTGVSLAPPRSP